MADEQVTITIAAKNLTAEAFKQTQDDLKKVSAEWKKTGREMQSVGTMLTVGVTAPIVASGAAVLVAGAQYDEAMSLIVRGTGASGTALQSLEGSFKKVWGTVPEGAAVVAQALADVNTRTGLMGDGLEDATRRMLAYARVNKEDVATSTRTVSVLMNALELDVSELPSVLDKLTFAAQRSGIGANALADAVIGGGMAFVELGFGLDESIALFSQFEKVGAKPTDVIGSLNIAITKLAREGFTDAEGAFNELLRQIKEAPDVLTATQIAADAFGAQVGSKLQEEIRGGTFEIDEFVQALQGAGGTLEQTAKDSETQAERLATLREEAARSVAPIGVELAGALERLIPISSSVLRGVGGMGESFAELPGPVKTVSFALAGVAAAAGPVVYAAGTVMVKWGELMVMAPRVAGALGVAAKGGLVFGAAIAGWTVGKWISDLKLFGDETLSLGESFEYSFVKMSNWWNGIKVADQDIEAAIVSRRNLASATSETGKAHDAANVAVDAHTKALEEVAAVIAATEAANREALKSPKALAEAQEKAAKEAAKHAAEAKKLGEEMYRMGLGFNDVGAVITMTTEGVTREMSTWEQNFSSVLVAGQRLQQELTLATLDGTARRLAEIDFAREKELAGLAHLKATHFAEYEALAAMVREKYGLMADAATGANQTIAQAAAEAGFKTRAELQATADQAVALHAAMQASGEFTSEAVKAAWEKAEAAKRAAGEQTKSWTDTANSMLITNTASTLAILGNKFKAASIAGAIISTYQAVAKSMASLPWPANLISAAGALAAGMANVNRIRSSEPGFSTGTPNLDYMNFGDERSVRLHRREAVIPEGGGHRLAREIAGALSSLMGSMSGDVYIAVSPQGQAAAISRQQFQQIERAVAGGAIRIPRRAVGERVR
ncbi:MAG: phage tail tape measure protein [Vicinamibacterales bacterium]|nr:phage tail tape measure protein [Vicinamibacterales bacterium]